MTLDDELTAAARAANRLTARWVRTWDGDGTVLSGAGVWPLLAALAEAADGETRDQLAAAVGLPATEGLDTTRKLLDLLNQSPAVHTALGLWTAESVPVNEQWAARLPGAAHGVLDPDPARSRAALDAWVEKETGGLLHHLPVHVDADTLLILASALTVRTKWQERFAASPTAGSGPWADRRRLTGLHRRASVSDFRITHCDDGPVTLALVRGEEEHGIDVVLALGEPGAHAGAVLSAAVSACEHTSLPQSSGVPVEPVDLDREQPGPGLAVTEIPSFDTEPSATLNTVAFTVKAHHDLLTHAEIFGLSAASDDETARFPGISEVPLYVQTAAQDAMASFSAEGFVAAAVTAVAMAAGAAMPRARAKRLTATFDRPFGFVAVHNPTGLALVAGWVTDPDDYPNPS